LKQRIANRNRTGEDLPDETERYEVARKRVKGGTPYLDPFKDHMKKMEDKLRAGGSAMDSPKSAAIASYGGFADPSNYRS